MMQIMTEFGIMKETTVLLILTLTRRTRIMTEEVMCVITVL